MDEIESIERWPALVAEQYGVMTRAQAVAHGLTDDRLRAQLEARRWERRGRGVVSSTTGLLSHEAQLRAVLLAMKAPAALSHETAGREWGLLPRQATTAPWHVTVPYGASARGHRDVHVHRSRAFVHLVVEHDGLLLTSREHTVLDLALAAPDAPTAMGVVLTTAPAGRVRPEKLAEAMDLRGLRRFRRAILEAIRVLGTGVTSVLEARYVLDVERAHGLPEATRQLPVVVDGHTLYEDCLYACPDGEAIVRLDGDASHAHRAVRLRDRRRGNAAELAGRARLVYGWEEVAGSACATAAEIAVLLRALGWTGPLLRCARCA